MQIRTNCVVSLEVCGIRKSIFFAFFTSLWRLSVMKSHRYLIISCSTHSMYLNITPLRLPGQLSIFSIGEKKKQKQTIEKFQRIITHTFTRNDVKCYFKPNRHATTIRMIISAIFKREKLSSTLGVRFFSTPNVLCKLSIGRSGSCLVNLTNK